jgi:serine/threonine protein kinase
MLLLLGYLLRRLWLKKRNREQSYPKLHMAEMMIAPISKSGTWKESQSSYEKSRFKFKDLAKATDDFSDSRLLGLGGFGKVYRGELPDGRTVAVKYSTVEGPSAVGEREFRSELEVISRVHHKHLVSFLGYALKGNKRLLVLQYMSNGTLQALIQSPRSLIWAGRLKAVIGAARGLTYLHEDCQPSIIHRDIKASNILMDSNMDARVADFGISKLKEESALETHISTRVMGTFGYLDPAYACTGRLTKESDIYSFGVVLLELVSGCKPVDMTMPPGEESLVEWARPMVEDRMYFNLVDPFLRDEGYDRVEMKRMIKTAGMCINPVANTRPSMSQVVRFLEGNGIPDSPRRRLGSMEFEQGYNTMVDPERFHIGR